MSDLKIIDSDEIKMIEIKKAIEIHNGINNLTQKGVSDEYLTSHNGVRY